MHLVISRPSLMRSEKQIRQCCSNLLNIPSFLLLLQIYSFKPIFALSLLRRFSQQINYKKEPSNMKLLQVKIYI